MKTLKAATGAVAATLLCSCACLSPSNNTAAPDPAVAKVMQEVYPALVRIYVVTSDFDAGKEIKTQAAGSGSIISADGCVVTNHHVVGHAKRIWCTLPNKERVEAELVGTDPMTDIAVIRLQPKSMRNPVASFPYAKWGDSDKVVAGQRVFAMGSPGAIAQSITCGIVANPKIVMLGSQMMLDGESVGSLVPWIFHDAQIYHGNSGGPLVNAKGEIIGVNELGTAALGGAIPGNIARQVANELIEHQGSVPRSWTGLQLQKLLMRDAEERGALVASTAPDSPAEKAGVLPGDKILAVNGIPITYRYDEELPAINRLLLGAPVGSQLRLQLLRNGQELELSLTTEPRGLIQAPEKACASWGISASDLNRFTAPAYKLKPGDGVLVTGVTSGGPADQAKPRLGSGDVVTAVGDQAVGTLEQLLNATKARLQGKTEPVPTMVRFRRGQDELLTVVDLGPEPEASVIPTARKAWFAGNVQVFTKPLAEAMGLKDVHGVRITRLFPQLANSDFRIGDILTRINGKNIDAYDPSHADIFPTMIRECSSSEPTEFSVLRNGQPTTIAVVLPLQPKPEAEMPTYKNEFFGVKVRKLSVMDKIARDMDLKSEGVIVDSVENGGWAQLGGLLLGDVIVTLNTQDLTKTDASTGASPLDSVKAELERCVASHPESLVLFVKRGRTGSAYIEIRPDWKE